VQTVLRDQVRDLASQNTGIEIPIRAKIMSNGSKIVPFRITASTPVRMLNTTQMTAARTRARTSPARRKLLRGRPAAPGAVGDEVSRDEQPLHHQQVLHGLRAIEPELMSHGCDRLGRRVAARERSGRIDSGVAKKIRNTSTVIAKRTAMRPSSLRTMKRPMALALQPQLGPRIERVANAVSEHVQRQTVSRIMMPGASRPTAGCREAPGRRR